MSAHSIQRMMKNRRDRDATPAPYTPDHTVNAAQRDFLQDADPVWELKPREHVCGSCWLVQPCDCDA